LGRVTQTPRARADLDDIWLHIAQDSPAAADRLIDQLIARCQNLAEHPQLGPARPEIAPDARMLVVRDYLVLYRLDGDNTQIMRILHGARQMEGLFDAGPGDSAP
jgi:toxin ParE1/3/4